MKNCVLSGDGVCLRTLVRTASKLASHMRPRFKTDTMVFHADANSPSPTLTGYTSLPGTHLGGKKNRAKRVVAQPRTVRVFEEEELPSGG